MELNGRQIPIDEFTTPSPIVGEKTTPLSVIRAMMKDAGVRHIPIAEQGRPIGLISERDVNIFAGALDLDLLVAEDIMAKSPYVVKARTSLYDAVRYMSEAKIGSAIVVDEDNTLSGIFTATDALNALIELLQGNLEVSSDDLQFQVS